MSAAMVVVVLEVRAEAAAVAAAAPVLLPWAVVQPAAVGVTKPEAGRTGIVPTMARRPAVLAASMAFARRVSESSFVESANFSVLSRRARLVAAGGGRCRRRVVVESHLNRDAETETEIGTARTESLQIRREKINKRGRGGR